MSDAPRPLLSRSLSVLLGAAALVITIAGLRFAAGFLAPILLAATVAVCAYPLIGRFELAGLPRRGAVWATLGSIVALLSVVLYAVVWALTRFAALLPRYRNQATEWFESLRARAEEAGFGNAQLQSLLADLDHGRTASWAAGFASSVAGLTLTAFVVVFLVGFMVADSPAFAGALRQARRERPELVDALIRATAASRENVLLNAVFGLGLAAVITILMWIMGVPGAPIWGILTFVTNFIPNIGFLIRVTPPVVIAGLESGVALAVAVVVVFTIANIIAEHVLRPRFVGRSAGLSSTASLLSLVFWTFALGAIGAILAVPLTIFARALLIEADPRTRWLGPFLGEDRPGAPPTT